jgi:hypothetical protein
MRQHSHFTAFFLSLVLVCLQNPIPSRAKIGHPEQKKAGSTQQPASKDQRGTDSSPVLVKIIPTLKTPEETAQDAEDRKEKSTNDRRLVLFTGVLALIGALQLFVFGYQAYKLKQTVEAALGQSEDMKHSIAEAARAANAMENVATHVELSAKTALDSVTIFKERMAQQMRAYITVLVGQAFYQERAKNIRFEARPAVVNSGLTPAHKVRFAAKADILPVPIPADFAYPIPKEPVGSCSAPL